MMITDEMVEAAAIKFCEAEDRDPHQLTYITDDGVTQPYGDAWQWYADGIRAALTAAAPLIIAQPEREAWRPIHTIMDEIVGQYLVETERGEIVLWHLLAGPPVNGIRYRCVPLPPTDPTDV